MRYVLIYWVIGCIAVGSGLASRISKCPDAKYEPTWVAASVSIWPAILWLSLLTPRPTEDVCATSASIKHII